MSTTEATLTASAVRQGGLVQASITRDALRPRSAPRSPALPAMLAPLQGPAVSLRVVGGSGVLVQASITRDAFRPRSAPRSLALPAMLPQASGVDLLEDLVGDVVV